MGKFLKRVSIIILIGMWMSASTAAELATKEVISNQLKELDVQVQDVKKDMLDISTRLIQLEDRYIYPDDTRLSIFLSVAEGDIFQFDTVMISIDGKNNKQHIYTPREVAALQHGGVQRLYTGSILNGPHVLEVVMTRKSVSNRDYLKIAEYKFTKEAGTKFIEINLARPGSSDQITSVSEQIISFKD